MASATISSRIILGIERLRCPRCGRINIVEVHSDLAERDWLICKFCGYKAIINFVPVLDKYGLPYGLTKPERRGFGKHLQKDLIKL